MNRLVRRSRCALRMLALALIVAAVPLPVLAGDGSQVTTKPRLQASVKPIVHAVVAARASESKGAEQAKPADTAPLESKSFFKTTTGLAVLAVLAAGTGYAFYSIQHDRVQPTGR